MSLSYPLMIQLLANALGKTADDGTSARALATHVGDEHGVSGPWLCPSPALAFAAIWGVNQ